MAIKEELFDFLIEQEASDVPGYPIGATHWAYIHQIEGFEDA